VPCSAENWTEFGGLASRCMRQRTTYKLFGSAPYSGRSSSIKPWQPQNMLFCVDSCTWKIKFFSVKMSILCTIFSFKCSTKHSAERREKQVVPDEKFIRTLWAEVWDTSLQQRHHMVAGLELLSNWQNTFNPLSKTILTSKIQYVYYVL